PFKGKWMTWDDYLVQMQDRLKELGETDPNPNQTYHDQWWERAGQDPGINMLQHVQTPAFEDMLAENGVTRDQFPVNYNSLKPEQKDPTKLDDVATLEDWLMLFLPHREWD
ncbi:MAG: hypothetical protein KGL39_41615, partial [Patescibacteria group bacterium]|nr:hypothetical protein [Patescibacteria group bacterium]